MRGKKGFFFSLLTLIVVIMLFFYFKNVQEAKKTESELETQRYTLLQYNEFQKDLKYKYVPSQVRLITKMALLNISMNGSMDLASIDGNMTEAVLLGKVGSVAVLEPGLTFFSSMDQIHKNWLFSHTYNYTVHNMSFRQKDWQNITINYSMAFLMNASGNRYSLDMNGSVAITSLGINTSLGLITPLWWMNISEPCTLKRISPGYDCAGVRGIAPS